MCHARSANERHREGEIDADELELFAPVGLGFWFVQRRNERETDQQKDTRPNLAYW